MASVEPTGPTAAQKLYFAAWRWHFYAGIYVIPFILLLSVTGILMVWFTAISPEYGERLRVTPGTPLPITAQVEAAAQGGTVTAYMAPFSPENPALFRVAGDQTLIVAVDPATGSILRQTVEGDTWEEWADRLHGELGLTGDAQPYGDFAVELAATLTLMLVATGLYLAWPRGGRGISSIFVPDLRAKGRAFWKSLHLTLGTWASGLLVVFLISGLSWAGLWGGQFVQAWSTFPAEKWDNVPLSDDTHASMNHTARETVPWALEQTPMPASGSDAGVDGLAEGVAPSFEAMAALARQIGFQGRFQVNAPAGETGVWTITQDSMSNDSPDPTADRTVHLDQYSGKILADVRFADYSLAGKAMAVGIPFHMGLMGTWSVVLNIGFCLALILISLSGMVMWWKRRPAKALRLAAPPRPVDVPMARGVLLIALALSLAFPLLGVTLLAVLALDMLVLSQVPLLQRLVS